MIFTKKMFSLTWMLFFATIIVSYAQNSVDMNTRKNRLPERKYKNNEPSAFFHPFRSTMISWILGTHNTSFVNPVFHEYINNKTIQQRIGTSFCARIEPSGALFFDIKWFSSKFTFEGDKSFALSEANKIRHRGVEFSANMTLLPGYKYFRSFVGIGVQSASLVAANQWPMEGMSEEKRQENPSIDYKYSGCSAPIFKVGMRIGSPTFFGNLEFKQGLNYNSPKHYNQFSFGVGIIFDKY